MHDGKVGFRHQICISVNSAGLFLPRFLNAAPLCSSSGGGWRTYSTLQMNELGCCRLHVQRWCGQPCKLYCMCRFLTRFSGSCQFNCIELFLSCLHQEEYLNYIRTWQFSYLLWSQLTSFLSLSKLKAQKPGRDACWR